MTLNTTVTTGIVKQNKDDWICYSQLPQQHSDSIDLHHGESVLDPQSVSRVWNKGPIFENL